MPLVKLPHPVPYQGSKRNLAIMIGEWVPLEIDTWYEPFAGSAAMSIWAAHYRRPRRIVLGDSLAPVADLWEAIIANPTRTAARYAELWHGQTGAHYRDYYLSIRERYNTEHDPVDLLYLTARCVKNAVRFNKRGHFTQSADKRRLGMQPEKMRTAIEGAAAMLRGKTEIRRGDWLDSTADAKPDDFVYMDPPYLGTSIGRDLRYAEQMMQGRLVCGLRSMVARKVRFALSYDGMTGDKIYGPPLPKDIGMTRLLLHAGKSSQATLNGKDEETVESLYLSPGLSEIEAPTEVIRARKKDSAFQTALAI